MATQLYRAFNAAVRKSLQLVPSKPIYSKSCVCQVPKSVVGRHLVPSRTTPLLQSTPGTGLVNYTQSILKLPWSSIIRSFYSNANPTPRLRQSPSSSWTPSLRYNKLGFKTWASLPPFLLTFPLLPVVHCEGQPGPRPKPSTTCACEFRFETPNTNCGPTCVKEFQPPPPLQPPIISVLAVQTEPVPVPLQTECIPVQTVTPPPPCTPTPLPSPPSVTPTPPPPPSVTPTPPPPSIPTTPPTNEYNGMAPIDWCETTDLNHRFLVRQACQLTVDSVTRILCETIAAYQDYHEKYRCILDALIESLENSRTSEGVQLDLLDCRTIMMRAESDNMKCRILELEGFMCSVQRLSEATAETTFLGGAEYHSLAMSERLDSVQREMRAIKEETCRKERDMIELQQIVIIEAGKGLK